MFNSLKQGSQVWVLDKTKKMLVCGTVTEVTAPVNKFKLQNPNAPYAMPVQTEMVMDFKVEGDEDNYEVSQVNANNSVEQRGDCVFADSREAMLQEVEAWHNKSQAELDREEYNRSVVDAAKAMFKTLNPTYAREQERDEAIEQLRGDMGDINDRLDKITDLITRALSKGNNK